MDGGDHVGRLEMKIVNHKHWYLQTLRIRWIEKRGDHILLGEIDGGGWDSELICSSCLDTSFFLPAIISTI